MRRATGGRQERTLAVILSVIIPGLGQAYLGRFGRALIWFAGIVAITVTLTSHHVDADERFAFGALLGIVSAIDAAVISMRPPGSDTGPGRQ